MDDKNLSALTPSGFDADQENSSGTSVSVVELYVSLFLILLCFFLVMDSISNQQLVKAHAAVKSIKAAFKEDLHDKPKLMELVARGKLDAPSDQYYSQIHGVLAGMVDFPGKYPDREMNPVRVEVPPEILFVRGQSKLRFDQAQFFDDLATALKTAPPDEERSVEILVGSGSDLPGDDKMWRNLYVKRAANFAKELEKRGVPGRLVSAGVMAENSHTVWLAFLVKHKGPEMGGRAVAFPTGEGKPR